MDRFDLSDLTGVSQQSMLFGSYPQPQPSSIKRQQNIQPNYNLPIYNSIEDWNTADLTTDSAPSPGSNSPVSPIFGGFASSFTTGDEWTSWDKIEHSPESDFFLKSELLDSPDLSSIPIMSPALNPMDLSNTGFDEVVQFGREGVNDTRPLFQSPQMNITMPPQQQSINASASRQPTNTGLPTPPEASANQQRRYPTRPNLKRKSSSDDDSTPSSPRSSCSPPPPQRRHTGSSPKDESPASSVKPALGPKKTAHNMIEKRYRTNLNDKIAALRDSVPALRVMVHRLEHTDEDPNNSGNIMDEIKAEAGLDPEDDLGGVTPAHKLNKATILSKATEYIAHLEQKNRALAKENSALRNRVEGFEMLVMNRGGHNQRPMWQ
ncbi:Sterol regulatory element-binding protein 1 [Cytospora mali]|uniref:Sterol regulatory element-binding protein 1 n=1 Tax=Cytospora mali TaxID=578113 RepID=A0A194UR73_CYTMA|nr:Sterol regulatory element-binding protein 1 [Valsa mali var. pyri (nom. inval.)]